MFENVIDMMAVRRKRQQAGQAVSVDFDLNKQFKDQQAVDDQIELLVDNIREIRQAFKIPGMQGLDDVFQYLMSDVHVPFQSTNAKAWFAKLGERDQAKVRMIAMHGTRIEKLLNEITAKISAYEQLASRSSAGRDQLNYLYSEVQSDDDIVSVLRSLI